MVVGSVALRVQERLDQGTLCQLCRAHDLPWGKRWGYLMDSWQ